MKTDDRVQEIIDRIEALQDEKLSVAFATITDLPDDNQMKVMSSFGGTYNEGIVMVASILMQMRKVMDRTFFEIFVDLMANLTLNDKKDEDKTEEELADDKQQAKKLREMMTVINGKKPD